VNGEKVKGQGLKEETSTFPPYPLPLNRTVLTSSQQSILKIGIGDREEIFMFGCGFFPSGAILKSKPCKEIGDLNAMRSLFSFGVSAILGLIEGMRSRLDLL
jgi:hypothetical protein